MANFLVTTSTNTADNPIPVKVSIDLLMVNIDLYSQWSSLLNILNIAQRYVELDLSDCTGMTTFDPGTDSAGKEWIVSLVLPNISTSTSTGSFATYNYFTSLKEISGTGIKTLGDYSFANHTDFETIVSVDFPALTDIGAGAFFLCTGLTNITIPDGVTIIEDDAFGGCDGLTSVNIPASVNKIGYSAFGLCEGLQTINVDSNNASFSSENGILYNKNFTTLMQYPGGKEGAVIIPNSVSTIARGAFYNCSNIYSVTIPPSVITIEDGAFSGDLLEKYFDIGGGPGTYTTTDPGKYPIWTKE